MSTLQNEVIKSLDGLSDENLSFLLNMIYIYMKPKKSKIDCENRNSSGIKIGMYEGEKYIADGYDFDRECEEIVEMFEVI